MQVRRVFIGLGLLVSALPLCAQEKGEGEAPVDQAKILVGQLWELSDGATRKEVLMPLYETLREVELSQGGLGLEVEAQRPKQQSNLLSLLGNRAIRDEVGMEDYQYEELRQKTLQLRQSMAEQVRAVVKSGERDPQRIVEMIGEIRERGEKQIRDSVLPHQMSRLRQVGFQTLMRSRDPVEVITSEPLASELGLEDEEKKRLREKAQELREEFDRKVEALRRETVAKLFEELDADQRKKIDEMLGEEFDLAALKRADQKGDNQAPEKSASGGKPSKGD